MTCRNEGHGRSARGPGSDRGAPSIPWARLVAATAMTRWRGVTPSSSVSSCATARRSSSLLPASDRFGQSVSSSSMKRSAGVACPRAMVAASASASARANVVRSRAHSSSAPPPPPLPCSTSSGSPKAAAAARTTWVLPVPGGPYRSSPAGGRTRHAFSASACSVKPPTSAHTAS